MCKEQLPERDEVCRAWKRTDYGINLYPSDPQNNATIDTGPMFIDLNERVAKEMKKDIFLYFRHYSFKRGPCIWRQLGTDAAESKKSHWWAKLKRKFSERRRKWLIRTPPKANDHVYNNSDKFT